VFTGIIEQLATVVSVEIEGSNHHFTLRAALAPELKIDQSVAHDGVCLTVVAVDAAAQTYRVTAIQETLHRTALGRWEPGGVVNLERCMLASGRFDGHIVQGHVDATGTLRSVLDRDGSWRLEIAHEAGAGRITVEKGSITLNGVSLTVVDSGADFFSVELIPYTWEHTNLSRLQPGDPVNLEFDIVGKYVARLLGK
jgi:riboflavin synthase